jgi:spore germination protein KC
MLGQSSKVIYFEHISVIIISEDVLKTTDLTSLLDFWLRDAEMRWRVKVYVTPGEARQFLQFNPPSGEPGGRYLAGISESHKKDTHIAGIETDLGSIAQAIDNQFDVFIPRIEMVEQTVKVGGVALCRKDRFVGYADEYTTRGGKFIAGTNKNALIPVDCPLHPEGTIAFEMFHQNTRLKPHFEDGNLYFTLAISMEGNLSEVSCRKYHDTAGGEFIKFVEQLIAEEVKRNTLHSYSYFQAMRVDPLGFSAHVKGRYPRQWKNIKDHWEEIFPTVPLYVTAEVTIRGLGEHK